MVQRAKGIERQIDQEPESARGPRMPADGRGFVLCRVTSAQNSFSGKKLPRSRVSADGLYPAVYLPHPWLTPAVACLLVSLRTYQGKKGARAECLDWRFAEIPRVARDNHFDSRRERCAGLEGILEIRHAKIAGAPRFGRSNRANLERPQYFIDSGQRLFAPGGLPANIIKV